MTIDAVDAPGLALRGGGTDRVLIVNADGEVTAHHLLITGGYGYQLASGILNNGDLTLDHVTAGINLMTTEAGELWQGGGGIYNGDGASLCPATDQRGVARDAACDIGAYEWQP